MYVQLDDRVYKILNSLEFKGMELATLLKVEEDDEIEGE